LTEERKRAYKSFVTILLSVVISSALCAAFPAPADHDVYRGSVSFKNFGDHMLGILLVDERGRDAGYVHLFRLWTKTAVSPVSVNAANASVEYRGRELIILIPQKKLSYTFVISDAQSEASPPPLGFAGVQYVGYGLNHEVRLTKSKTQDDVECYFTTRLPT